MVEVLDWNIYSPRDDDTLDLWLEAETEVSDDGFVSLPFVIRQMALNKAETGYPEVWCVAYRVTTCPNGFRETNVENYLLPCYSVFADGATLILDDTGSRQEREELSKAVANSAEQLKVLSDVADKLVDMLSALAVSAASLENIYTRTQKPEVMGVHSMLEDTLRVLREAYGLNEAAHKSLVRKLNTLSGVPK